LTKKNKITRKYKVLKPFPEATVAYTVYLFQFLYARQDLRLSVQHRAQGNTKDTQLSFLMGMGISTEDKEDQFTVQEVTLAHSESNSPVCAGMFSVAGVLFSFKKRVAKQYTCYSSNF